MESDESSMVLNTSNIPFFYVWTYKYKHLNGWCFGGLGGGGIMIHEKYSKRFSKVFFVEWLQ